MFTGFLNLINNFPGQARPPEGCPHWGQAQPARHCSPGHYLHLPQYWAKYHNEDIFALGGWGADPWRCSDSQSAEPSEGCFAGELKWGCLAGHFLLWFSRTLNIVDVPVFPWRGNDNWVVSHVSNKLSGRNSRELEGGPHLCRWRSFYINFPISGAFFPGNCWIFSGFPNFFDLIKITFKMCPRVIIRHLFLRAVF